MTVDLIIWMWSLFTPISPIGQCDSDTERLAWTDAERQEAREMATESLRERGARPIFLAFVDAATIRETHGVASRWQDGGTGLGLHGINITTHAKRWPTPLSPAICWPQVSAAIVQDIAHDCAVRHGASTPWELQACYAGRFECIGDGGGKECTARQQDQTTWAICGPMEARGFSCHQPITAKDLGRRIPQAERKALTGRAAK